MTDPIRPDDYTQLKDPLSELRRKSSKHAAECCAQMMSQCDEKHRIMQLRERVIVIEEHIAELRDRKKILLHEIKRFTERNPNDSE